MRGADAYAGATLRVGRFISIDPEKYTATVQFAYGETMVEEVVLSSPMISPAGGGHGGGTPARESWGLFARPAGVEAWYFIAAVPIPTPDKDDISDHREPERGPRNDYSMGRAPTEENLQIMQSPAGPYTAVHPSGVIDLCIDELCFWRAFPDARAFQEFAFTFSKNGPWGYADFFTDREDALDEAAQTPTGLRAGIRSTSSMPEHIFLDVGSVRGVDEEMPLPGRPKRSSKGVSKTCFRLLVFDQGMAKAYADRGMFPDPSAARLSVRFDEEGNVLVVQAGSFTYACDNLTAHVRGNADLQVDGTFRQQVQGPATLRSQGQLEVSSSRSMTLSSGGDLTIRCRRLQVHADNDRWDVSGPFQVRAQGDVGLQTAAGSARLQGRDVLITAAGATVITTGGVKREIVAGSAAPENFGRDFLASLVKVLNGKAVQVVEKGSHEWLLGPQASPIARIKLHGDPTQPQNIGTFEVTIVATRTTFLVRPDGSFKLGGPKADIRCDAAGNIQLGSPVGVPGNVVTSMSHMCYITGLPARGVPGVTVTQKLPGVPGPGRPNAGPLPVVNTPDIPTAE